VAEFLISPAAPKHAQVHPTGIDVTVHNRLTSLQFNTFFYFSAACNVNFMIGVCFVDYGSQRWFSVERLHQDRRGQRGLQEHRHPGSL
jgi:hypothetical protein